MNPVPAISTAPVLGANLITRIGSQGGVTAPPANVSGDFATILSNGVQNVESKVASADALVRRFALDDSIPVHQVTYALEEARLSVELAMQVRSRLVETYRDLMAMQL